MVGAKIVPVMFKCKLDAVKFISGLRPRIKYLQQYPISNDINLTNGMHCVWCSAKQLLHSFAITFMLLHLYAHKMSWADEMFNSNTNVCIYCNVSNEKVDL